MYDPAAAQAFGLAEGQVCVMIHCGSRGLGHQICADQVQIMDTAMARYGITVPDRQLACAPGHAPRRAAGTWAPWPRPRTTPGPTARCSPRRPARSSPAPPARRWTWSTTWPTTSPSWKPTRSAGTPPGCACTARGRPGRCRPAIPDLPADLREAGQPVLIPGSMGTASYVLAGVPGGGAFASTCHGAGRRMSRHQAARSVTGPELRRQLEAPGHRRARRLGPRPGRGDPAGIQGRQRRWSRPPRAPGCAGRSPGSSRSASSKADRLERCAHATGGVRVRPATPPGPMMTPLSPSPAIR